MSEQGGYGGGVAGESGGDLPPAGWYDDPMVSGGKRYWDGRRWTEAVHGPTPATPPGAPIGGPPLVPAATGGAFGSAPPFDPLPPGLSATGGSDGTGFDGADGKINDLGDWLGRTFSVLRGHWQPVAILALLSLPLWLLVVFLGHQLASGLTWTDNDGFTGFNAGLAVAVVGLALVALAVTLVSYLGLHHYLYAAHVGRAEGWVQSLRVGLTRQPRFLGLSLLILVITVGAIAIPNGLFLAGVLASDVNVSLLFLGMVAGLAAGLFLIWFWVKVGAFATVAAAVVPRGASAFMASWRLSRGRFWPMLARVAIMYALAATTSTITQIVTQSMAPLVLFSKVEITDVGDVYVNGRNVDTIDVLSLGDLLPNPVGLLFYLLVVAVTGALSQVITASATAALYADAKGENSLDHR